MMVPLQYMGDGEFRAPKGHAARCDKDLVIGEVLTWEIRRERSDKSHNHFFALVHEAWVNLPEAIAHQFTHADHLRKYALIKAGYCTTAKVVTRDNAEAIRTCALMQAMDNYAVCEVAGNVVTVWRAKSQSVRAMGAKEFQASKEAVLTVLSQMIGADVTGEANAA